MSDLIYNQTIVVYDQKTNGIVCSADSDAHAAAISLGLTNAKFLALDRAVNPDCDKFDYNDPNVHYFLGLHNFHIEPLDIKFFTKFFTPEWVDLRILSIDKAKVLRKWEFSIRQHLSRLNDFYGWSSVLPFLTEQLSLCDPQNNHYTKAIIEWGEIQDISPSAAYQELKIRQEGHGISYLRRHALYQKHVKNISLAKTLDELRYQETLAKNSLPRVLR